MKLSFSLINSIDGFLARTTVAAIVFSYPVEANALDASYFNAKTTQKLAQITFVTPVKLDSLSEGALEESIDKSNTSLLHLYRERYILVSNFEPSPPLPDKSGGSR